MSVQTNGATGQAPATGTPQAGQAPAATQDQQGQQGTDAGQAPTGDAAKFDPATIQDPALRAWAETQAAELARARGEAAQFRTERAAAQQQVQQFQRQNETAEQQAQRESAERDARYAALEQENRSLKVGTAVQGAAATAKAFNPSLVADMLQGRVELDAEGKPSNVAALLAALKASDPYLFAVTPQSGDAGAGRGTGSAPGPSSAGESINAALRSRGGNVSPGIR